MATINKKVLTMAHRINELDLLVKKLADRHDVEAANVNTAFNDVTVALDNITESINSNFEGMKARLEQLEKKGSKK